MEIRCGRCGKAVKGRSTRENPDFPFCSPRCRMADLDHWFTEDYTVPGDPDDGVMGEEELE